MRRFAGLKNRCPKCPRFEEPGAKGGAGRYNRNLMSEELNPPPADPVIRFRLRTMIALTALVGVMAALVGWLFRHASEITRIALLTEWGVTLAFVFAFAGRRWQLYVRGVRAAGAVRFVLRQRRPWSRSVSQLPIFWTFLAISLLGSYWQSIEWARTGVSYGPIEAFFKTLLIAPMLCTAGYYIMSRVASGRRVRLCEQGLRIAGEFKDWRQASLAQWDLADDRVLLISTWTERSRYELLVPLEEKSEIERFVRLKTHFVDDAASPPV